MKPLYLVIALMSLSVSLFAQTNTFKEPESSFNQPMRYKKHCVTTRIGEGFLLGGGAIVATAGIGYLVASAAHPSADIDTKNNTAMLAVAFGAIGANFALNGAVVFLIGKLYERNHKERFSVISTPNRLGVVYNF